MTCFAVIDTRINGKTCHHIPISPWFATLAQAKHCKAQKQTDFPNCYIYEGTGHFSFEFEEDRLEFLTQIIGVDQGDTPLLGDYWVRSFLVIQGGEDDPDCNSPISPSFLSKEQAKAFQALSRTRYPDCRILTQDYAANDEPSRQQFIDALLNEQSPRTPRQLAEDVLFLTVSCFTVVEAGNNGRQHIPIGPYFRTEAEAKSFQAEILAQYPHCRIAQHSFVPDDEAQRKELLIQLFGENNENELNSENLFFIEVTTNKLWPRAKLGERLIMERGVLAEKIGKDIVAVGTEADQPVQLAFYQEGMEYFAVMTAIQYKRGQTSHAQCNGDNRSPEDEPHSLELPEHLLGKEA